MNSLGSKLGSVAGRYRFAAPNHRWRTISAASTSARQPITLFSRLAAADLRKLSARPHLTRRGRLEAVLLLSREPLSLRKMAQLANLTDGTEARTLLDSLSQRYDERGCA